MNLIKSKLKFRILPWDPWYSFVSLKAYPLFWMCLFVQTDEPRWTDMTVISTVASFICPICMKVPYYKSKKCTRPFPEKILVH